MAVCEWCNRDMSDPKTTTCTGNTMVDFPDGESMIGVHVNVNTPDGRCHDCNAKNGGYHHPGCDAERCPRCGGQLISCGCLDEDNEDYDDDWES